MGPDGVDALGAATAGLVLAGVHEHEVVDDAVRLEDVAVTVDVALVLDVVVRPREVRLGGGERVDRVVAERARRRPDCPGGRSWTGWRPARHSPLAFWVQRYAPYHASECGTVTHGVAEPLTVYAPLDISSYMFFIV